MTSVLLFMGLGIQEVLLLVGVLVFFFGAKKIPEIARGLGKSMSEFKKGQNEPTAKEDDAPVV